MNHNIQLPKINIHHLDKDSHFSLNSSYCFCLFVPINNSNYYYYFSLFILQKSLFPFSFSPKLFLCWSLLDFNLFLTFQMSYLPKKKGKKKYISQIYCFLGWQAINFSNIKRVLVNTHLEKIHTDNILKGFQKFKTTNSTIIDYIYLWSG